MDNLELEETPNRLEREYLNLKQDQVMGIWPVVFACVDILVSLYYDDETKFNHRRGYFNFQQRSWIPVIYPILADLGYYDEEELEKYCTPEGILSLHADQSIPGCHFVGGSLGNGVGYAAGFAFASGKNVYVIGWGCRII